MVVSRLKRRSGKAAGRAAAKERVKKRAKVARKRAASKKRARVKKPVGPTGARVEIRPTRRKQLGGNYQQEWLYRAFAANGRLDGGLEESVKNRRYAIKRADRDFPNRPIYIMPKGTLVPDDERPSRQPQPNAPSTAGTSTDTSAPMSDRETTHYDDEADVAAEGV